MKVQSLKKQSEMEGNSNANEGEFAQDYEDNQKEALRDIASQYLDRYSFRVQSSFNKGYTSDARSKLMLLQLMSNVKPIPPNLK